MVLLPLRKPLYYQTTLQTLVSKESTHKNRYTGSIQKMLITP